MKTGRDVSKYNRLKHGRVIKTEIQH